MRQRRVKGIDEKIAVYADLILPNSTEESVEDSASENNPFVPLFNAQGTAEHLFVEPSDAVKLHDAQKVMVYPSVQLLPSGRPVRWYQRTSPRYMLPEGYDRAYAEFGCGRGRFINEMAAEDPKALYIGIEGCKTVVVKAMAKTRAAGLENIRFIDAFINEAGAAFDEDSLDGVFLNFSDPWPKDRHASRRLSAPEKARAYQRILKPGGMVVFKTDGEEFFKYSIVSFSGAGFHIIGPACENGAPSAAASSGVALSGEVADRAVATPTEYEQRFRALGQPIYHFIAAKR